ncbi:MAG: hypothetical protein ACHQIK_00865 [Candidatus Acidiferrales bacterium]
MGENPKCIWTGQSGAQYTYFIHALPVAFNTGQPGNYIYSRMNDQGKCVPIYIGEGDLADRVGDGHHQAACIKRKGATHVHAHLNANQKDRTDEETDLLARYTNAYKPNGCNEREGG